MSETLAEICFYIGQQHHASAARREDARDFEGAQRDFAVAEQWYRRAFAEDPTAIKIHEAMMYALISQRRHAEALPHCDVVMNDPDPHKKLMTQVTRGLTEMMVGDYKNGFADLHARLKISAMADVPYRHKIEGRDLWDGKPVDHLLVYGEQGFGDVIMFSRFIPEIIRRGVAKRVTLEIHPDIVGLMRRNLRGDFDVVPYQFETIQADAFTLMVSVCTALGTEIDSIPVMPRLKAEPSFIEKWEYVSRLNGLKVGIAWAGRPAHDVHTQYWNAQRGIALKAMEPILFTEGVSFVSLQKGPEEKQLTEYPFIHEFAPHIKSWSDTAAIIHHLDLVISIDSGPVHLAAAMGKPTWLLNHRATCWRWNLTGETTPWYDTVTIHRQQREGDWSHPVSEIAASLDRLACGFVRNKKAAA